MKTQAFNPYLPSWEYIPDGEPRVFGDRLYVYGSHDKFGGAQFCENDYVCWSAPVGDLSDWRFEGVIYSPQDDPASDGGSLLFAPDVTAGTDGRYYLYYALHNRDFMGVAVCDSPCGKFVYYGAVQDENGRFLGDGDAVHMFDPGVFADDDGQVYLYSGSSPLGEWREHFLKIGKTDIEGAYLFKLEADMITCKSAPALKIPGPRAAAGTSFEAHPFFEASSMRKFNGRYYLIYSSIVCHELCYAVSDRPDGEFVFGGVLLSNGDVGIGGNREPRNFVGNNHGSIAKIGDEFYIFYHRHTNRCQFSRQGCAERLVFNADGSFDQAETTSCGLNGKPLSGRGEYEARIACVLMSADGGGETPLSDRSAYPKNAPYFTQTGGDREDRPDQYVENVQNGEVIGFRYFDIEDEKIAVEIIGDGAGVFEISDKLGGAVLAEVPVGGGSVALNAAKGVIGLYFTYRGEDTARFRGFRLG